MHPSRARAIARVDASMCISATRTKMRLDNPIASYISEYLYICFLLAPSHPCWDKAKTRRHIKACADAGRAAIDARQRATANPVKRTKL